MNFHRVLIIFGILFCWGFSIYEAILFSSTYATSSLILAIVFIILGCGMLYYLINLTRILSNPKE